MTALVSEDWPTSRTARLRRLICANQGFLAQYLLMAADLHRELKHAYHRRSENLDAVKQCYDDLILFLNVSLNRVVNSNFEYIRRCLSNERFPYDPRLSLVGPTDPDGKTALFLFRNPGYQAGVEETFETSRRTAIARVFETNSYYICQDLPAALKRGEYHNERLLDDAAERCEVNALSSYDDPAWCSLWKDGTTDSHYKSNLVIPVTFSNSPNLFEKEELGDCGAAVLDMKNKILGYLCMDHVCPNYFSEEDPYCIDVGYCAADMISIYLATRYQFTKYSDTFLTVSEMFPEASQ